MISFIIPFASKGYNLHDWKDTDSSMIIFSTIMVIKNINKIVDGDKEIILVDNTNTFPNIEIENLRIVKGLQYKKEFTSEEISKYKIDDVSNHSMWASIAYNIGIKHSIGDYIVLQHNDIFYHQNLLPSLINSLKTNEYVSVDSKHLTLTGYLGNKDIIDSLGIDFEIGHENGGYIKQKHFGLADCYFFMCKKEFFKDYSVDWGYGDTNHGATIKCLLEDKNFIHMGPFYGNSNYETNSSNTYKFGGEDFVTHLKGGFSEHNMSFKLHTNDIMLDSVNNYLEKLIEST